MKRAFTLVLFVALLAGGGCETPTPTDVELFRQHEPKTILVIPPLNRSAEAGVEDVFLATITMPLAERGFYVIPVVLANEMFKAQGVPTPQEMHQVSLAKLREIFGADAVLYTSIDTWTTEYIVLNSKTTVTVSYRLVSTATGTELWQRTQTAIHSSGGGGDPLAMVVAAAVHSIADAVADYKPGLAAQANATAILDETTGIPKGQRLLAVERERGQE